MKKLKSTSKIATLCFLCIFFSVSFQSHAKTINVTDPPYNADPTYAQDSTNAFNSWFSDVLSQHAQGHIPAGIYKLNTQLLWDYKDVASSGVIIYGDGILNTVLDFQENTACPAMQIENSAGNAETSVGYSYNSFHDFALEFNSSCVGMAIGQSNFTDCGSSFNFTNIWWGNVNSGNSNSSVTLQVNCLSSSIFQNVVVNNKTSYGTALELDHSQFNTFVGSFSNARIGIHLTSERENFDNVFLNSDIENVKYAVLNDSPNAKKNIFIGGEWDVNQSGGYVLSSSTGAIGHGGTITVEDINFATEGPTTNYFIDPNNRFGLLLKGAYTTTSPMNVLENIGSCNTVFTNTYSQNMWVFVTGGRVSTITIDNVAYSVSAGLFPLHPDSTISFECSTPPYMYWSAIVTSD